MTLSNADSLPLHPIRDERHPPSLYLPPRGAAVSLAEISADEKVRLEIDSRG